MIRRHLLWFAFSSFLLLATTASRASLSVGELRCEELKDPTGVDVAQPRLSWIITSSERDTKQSAYEILVATNEANLKPGRADLWDSGLVTSDASILVPYHGAPLTSRIACFWKVRVWDENGKASDWSKTATWSMGMLQPGDWQAQWIGQDGKDQVDTLSDTSWIWYPESESVRATNTETVYFRREVTIPADRRVKRAIFAYTGDNECRGWIDAFDLGARNTYHTVKWNDITGRLEPGKTYVFGLVGRTGGSKSGSAGVTGRLTIDFSDGDPLIIRTDEKWKTTETSQEDWLKQGFDDSTWASAQVLASVGATPWGEVRMPEDRRQPARYLRKEFIVGKKLARATVSFSGLGLSELYLNGKKVGDHVLSPAFAQYDKREYYVTYDVTKDLQAGANAMGVILGNGRFYADRSKVYASTVNFGWPKLILNLQLEYADGSVDWVASDGSWMLTTDGPIRANNDYDGEEYDARMELGDWTDPNYNYLQNDMGSVFGSKLQDTPRADDAKWVPAQIVSSPGGVLSAEMSPPIRVTGTLKPISVKELQPGVYVYDLGQNMVGWCRLHVRGKAGTTVILRHAETLKPDGSLYTANLRSAEVTDKYTLKGDGEETWEPRFVSHGFRFVEVTGYPGTPDLDAIEGRVVNDDLPTAGDFVCSSDIINRIYTNIVWGTRGNYRSLPTDCPQRDERQGWLGDRSEECKGESYLFDMDPLYKKWRQDMADAQRTNGVIPDVAPAYWPIYSDNVTWPSSAIIIPSALYRQFGDDSSIRQQYESSKLWMEHMLSYAQDDIIDRDSYGDWCVPPEEPTLIHSKDPARQTAKALLATSYYYYDLCLMEQYARLLGKTGEADHWASLAGEFKTAFNNHFLDRTNNEYSNGTQTSCVLPLAFGLVPDDMHDKIFAHLVDKIQNETHGHIGTGLIGGQYLNRVLSDNGRPELSYVMAAQKEYPGWGYMVEHGATTIWELWNGNTADPTMNSGNHVMLIGDLVIWFYEYLGGIAPDSPGFKTIRMKPVLVDNVTHVKATHNSPYGLISSEWQRDGDKFDWQIEVPANTTAFIYLPAESARTATENGRSLFNLSGVTPVDGNSGHCLQFQVGSGKYHFTSELP